MDDHTSSLVAWFYWFDVIETALMAIQKSHTSILLVRCLYSFCSLGPLILFDVQRKEENRWIKRKSIRFQIAKSYASHGSGWRMIESRQKEWNQREREKRSGEKTGSDKGYCEDRTGGGGCNEMNQLNSCWLSHRSYLSCN